MSAEQIAQLLSSMGAGAVLLTLVTGVIKWLSGSSARERERNTSLAVQRRNAIEDREAAELERDTAVRKQWEAEEHVSILKRQLLENGIQPRERTRKFPTGPIPIQVKEKK